jgi:ybaK/ebsC protein
MGKDKDKTNVMRILDRHKISYRHFGYDSDGTHTGVEIADMLNEDADRVFKTLVTEGKAGEYYVFVIPVGCELDLKKAAKAVGSKAVHMVKSKELLPLTGYIHGGCSPIGMKKTFTTVIHESAEKYDTIMFSAGKIGYQVEVSPDDLNRVIKYSYADVVC